MKKKLLVLVTALVMVLTCALGLVACGGSLEEGTYVMYGLSESDGQKIAVAAGEFELKDGKAKQSTHTGTYKVDGDTLTITFDGSSQKFTKDGNMWKASENGMTFALVKKGSKPDGYTIMEMPNV